MSKELALVRWIGEEKMSVEPLSGARKEDKVYVGSFANFKWGGKYYEAEILAISVELLYLKPDCRQTLNKALDQLAREEITREELLQESLETPCLVDSTTPEPSPVKQPAVKKRKLSTPAVDVDSELKKPRTKEKSSNKQPPNTAPSNSTSSTKKNNASTSSNKSGKPRASTVKEAKIRAIKERAKEMMSNSADVLNDSSISYPADYESHSESYYDGSTGSSIQNYYDDVTDLTQDSCGDEHEMSQKNIRSSPPTTQQPRLCENRSPPLYQPREKNISPTVSSHCNGRKIKSAPPYYPREKRISPSTVTPHTLGREMKGSSPDEHAQATSVIIALQREVEALKKQISTASQPQGSGITVVKKNVVSGSKFETLQKTVNYFPVDSSSDDGIQNNDDIEFDSPVQNDFPTKSRMATKLDSEPAKTIDDLTKNPKSEQTAPKKVELVDGYGVYLTQRQLDEAVDQSCHSPTRLVRNLTMVFFTPDVLACSSCLGTRKFPGLNKDIISACIKFTQLKFPNAMRSLLVDAINDKCANYRRKKK